MTMPEKKLILYGAGTIGLNVALQCAFEKVQIECFCDSDLRKCGKNYSRHPVKSIDEIKRYYPKGSYCILITIIKRDADRVKEELIDKNIFDEDDFYDEETDPLGIMRFLISRYDSFVVSQEIEQNFCCLNEENENTVKNGLLFHYFNVSSYDDLSSNYAKKIFSDHLYGRLNDDRKSVIPWLNSVHKLKGASILEIGCGTGTSTVALCEQGAKVTAVDVNENAMEAAKIRLKAYGLTADFMLVNAANILKELPGRCFDFIIFFASLEHMTFQERIQSLKSAFQMLETSGHVVLVEIPNRLWYIDGHTSREPFYHWLPDTLAMEYSKFTTRKDFNKGFDATSEKDALNFARWGRGVSYHELEVALGERSRFQVVSSLNSFLNIPDSFFKWILKMIGPEDIHEGFYESNLDIILKNACTKEPSNTAE